MKPSYAVLTFWSAFIAIIVACLVRGRYDGVAFLFTIIMVASWAMAMHIQADEERRNGLD